MNLEAEVILILLIGIIAVSGSVLYYFQPIAVFFTAHISVLHNIGTAIFDFLIVISFPVSLVFIIGIIVSIERLKRIRKKEHELYNAPVDEGFALIPAAGAKGSPETTNRWRQIQLLVDSTNQNDWRQAIIEADIILDEMLTKMSYHGDDLGSKLRGATKADFTTLDQAWEAHIVRNKIAHDGAGFQLSQHEAKRVINLYKQVFEEFYFI